MTIDEAIQYVEDLGTEEENKIDYDKDSPHTIIRRKNTVKDYRQLAEWLTELKEAMRLLKLAVEDISKMPCNNDTHSPDSCYICVKHGNCSYADSFKWCKADIALKLIGEDENET